MGSTRNGTEPDALMPDPIDLLERRVNSLEQAITDGLTRIETLLRQQIQDIKSEQLKDLKDNYQRLADDQRRAWDAIRELEKSRSQTAGGVRVMDRLWMVLGAPVAAAIIAWLAATHKP
jgi:hypothetical protein